MIFINGKIEQNWFLMINHLIDCYRLIRWLINQLNNPYKLISTNFERVQTSFIISKN